MRKSWRGWWQVVTFVVGVIVGAALAHAASASGWLATPQNLGKVAIGLICAVFFAALEWFYVQKAVDDKTANAINFLLAAVAGVVLRLLLKM